VLSCCHRIFFSSHYATPRFDACSNYPANKRSHSTMDIQKCEFFYIRQQSLPPAATVALASLALSTHSPQKTTHITFLLLSSYPSTPPLIPYIACLSFFSPSLENLFRPFNPLCIVKFFGCNLVEFLHHVILFFLHSCLSL